MQFTHWRANNNSNQQISKNKPVLCPLAAVGHTQVSTHFPQHVGIHWQEQCQTYQGHQSNERAHTKRNE